MTWKPVLALISIAAVVLALLAYHWWALAEARAGRDAWWRGEIARNSAAVQDEVAKKGEEVLLNDAALIAALGDESAKRKKAEATLADEQSRKRRDGGDCPRIPAQCLR